MVLPRSDIILDTPLSTLAHRNENFMRHLNMGVPIEVKTDPDYRRIPPRANRTKRRRASVSPNCTVCCHLEIQLQEDTGLPPELVRTTLSYLFFDALLSYVSKSGDTTAYWRDIYLVPHTGMVVSFHHEQGYIWKETFQGPVMMPMNDVPLLVIEDYHSGSETE